MSMGENKVNLLKKYRPAIIIAEIAALLHDIGKCDFRFLLHHGKNASEEERKYNHLKIIDYDKNILSNLELIDFFHKPLLTHINLVLSSYEDIVKMWSLDELSIGDIIEKHERYTPKKNEKLIALAQISDKKDAADDRLMPLAKQEKPKFYKASPFGIEEEIKEDSVTKVKEEIYKDLSRIFKNIKISSKESLSVFRKEIFGSYRKTICTIAETRRAANDVTLWDHSYMTASIMKALLAQDILSNFTMEVFDGKNVKRHFNFRLRILGIGWDASGFFEEASDLLGLAGREKILDDVKSSLKNLLEVDIPIGNCIYEDQNCICFLIPEDVNDIQDIIRKEITSKVIDISKGSIVPVIEISEAKPYPSVLLSKVISKLRKTTKIPIKLSTEIYNITSLPWITDWKKIKKAEICVECKKRPRMATKNICKHCQDLKILGIEKLKESMCASTNVFNETLWIDEISDENGNVALICGFIPLERWLNGNMLKTIFVKTISDIRNEYWNSRLNNEYKGKKIRDMFFKDYNTTVECLRSFVEELKNNSWNDAKVLLDPFFYQNFEVSPTKDSLYEQFTNFSIRVGSDKPERIVEILTKPPSPSRLLKIWTEVQEFFKELSEIAQDYIKNSIGGYCQRLKIKPKFISKKDEDFFNKNKYQFCELQNIDFDPRINLPKTDLWWDGEYFHTTIRIENYITLSEKVIKEDKKYILKEKHKILNQNIERLKKSEIPITLKIKEGKKERTIRIGIEDIKKEEYLPLRTVLISPMSFQVIIPANLAFNIIYEEYSKNFEDKFNKVKGRVSIGFGCLFFKRKMPIFVAIESVRRFFMNMIKNMNTLVKLGIKKDKNIIKIKSVNSEKLALQYEWKIDSNLGKDKIKDIYYPNFIVEENEDNKSKETFFKVKIGEKESAIINLEDLNENEILVYPSFFDFEYLDSNIRRFDILAEKESGKRYNPIIESSGPRPYLLEDLEKFQKLLEIFKIIGSWTPIRDIEAITMEKRKEWSETHGWENIKEEYEKFVDSVLENKILNSIKRELGNWEDNKNFLKECIMEGSFHDAIELFKSIMKIKLRGGEYET